PAPAGTSRTRGYEPDQYPDRVVSAPGVGSCTARQPQIGTVAHRAGRRPSFSANRRMAHTSAGGDADPRTRLKAAPTRTEMVPDRAAGLPDDRAADLVRMLYREHGAALLSYCTYRLGGDRQAAEDVVQETLLRAWRHADGLVTDGRSPRGWLVTVASRVI